MDQQAFAQLLGNYGEFLGAIAVVVTLIYLSIQIRQVKKQQEVEERQNREFAIRDFQMSFANSESLVRAVVGARDAVGEKPRGFVTELVNLGLPRTDAERVWSFYVAGIRISTNTYYTSGDKLQREANDSAMKVSYSSGLGALFWEHYSKAAGTALGPFREHVRSLLDSEDGGRTGSADS